MRAGQSSEDTVHSSAMDSLGPVSRKHQDWFDENDKEIQGLIEEKHQKHKAYLRNTSSVSSKTAYSNICKTVQTRLRDMQDSWLRIKADEIQFFADRKDMKSSSMHSRQYMVSRAQEPPHSLVQMELVFWLIKKLHLWTQIRLNCHVERFVEKRIIDQYKNRMFIHCRRGLYRKAWLSRDIYLSCVSQYWQGIKRAAMLTNRYGHSFQWGKSLSKDFKSLILDELTDCYGGNKDTMFIKYGAFSIFVCVEVLRPSQPNGVMSSAVNLPSHTFTGQA